MLNSYKTEFLRHLNDDELSLDDRLHMAYGAFISPDFPLLGKEQIIFEWFAACIKQNGLHLKNVLKVISKCLKCDWTLSDPIDTSKLIEVFTELDQEIKVKCGKSLSKCLILILKNLSFQRYCRYEIEPLCQGVLLVCELINITPNKARLDDSSSDIETVVDSRLEDLFDIIHHIHKVTQQRTELKLQFVECILPVFLKFHYNFETSEKFHDLLEELVIDEYADTFCKAFKCNVSGIVPDHLNVLVKLMVEDESKCDIVALNSLLFDVYANTCLKKSGASSSHISLFYILTSLAGFKLQLPYDTVNISNKSGSSLPIVRELVAVLQKHNIPSTTESEEGVLSNFLVVILKQLISGEHQLSTDLLQTLNNIFKVYPESVKLVFSGFVRHIVFAKKDAKVANSYDSLLVDVVKIFSDLNQLEKFFSIFFQGAVSLSKENDFTELTSEMILSSGFFTMVAEKFQMLTGNQLKTIIGRLEKIFSKDFILLLENDSVTDTNFCLLFKIMVKVLCHILENASVVTPTRWNIISEEFGKLILATQRFGIAVMASYDAELLLGFLQLVKTMAGIELIMNHYTISLSTTKILPVVESKDKSGSINNLSKSHGFLPTPEWKRISELVDESDNKELKHCWYDLLVQKYIKLNDQEVMNYVTLNTDSEWLWQNVEQMAGSVPLKHMEIYTEQLIGTNRCTVDDFNKKLSTLNNINIVTNRAFRAALSLQAVKQMTQIYPDKHSLSRLMVKLIDIHSLVEYEADASQPMTGEKLQNMNAMVDATVKILNKRLCECLYKMGNDLKEETRQQMTVMVDVLTLMNLHCFKSEAKQIFCVTLIGLAYDLREESVLLYRILELILGCMDDNSSTIPESMDKRVLLFWLVHVVPHSFHLNQELLQIAINKVICSIYEYVDEKHEFINASPGLLYAMLNSLILIHEKKGLKNNNLQKLAKLLVSFASSYVEEYSSDVHNLKSYTVALKAENVYFKEKTSVLLKNLPTFLKIVFKRFSMKTFDIQPNATDLLDFVLSIKMEIEPDIIDSIYKAMTTELCRTECSPMLHYPSTVKSFFESVPSEKFEQVLNEIYKHQYEYLISGKDTISVSSVCELWNIVVSASIDKDKAKTMHKQKLLIKVLSQCQPLLEKGVSLIDCDAVIKLLHSISVSKSVVLDPKLVDLIFVVLGTVPTETGTQLLPDCLVVLSSLIHAHSELIFDRIPAFLQRLRKFVKSLVLLSAVDGADSSAFNRTLTSSVNQFTRIIKIITDQHSKHFARIAPYLIADILHLLVTYSVQTSVKNEMQNCVCYLLSICDHHSTQLLQNLLPLPAIEMFKAVSTTYRKSYKYTGKV